MQLPAPPLVSLVAERVPVASGPPRHQVALRRRPGRPPGRGPRWGRRLLAATGLGFTLLAGSVSGAAAAPCGPVTDPATGMVIDYVLCLDLRYRDEPDPRLVYDPIPEPWVIADPTPDPWVVYDPQPEPWGGYVGDAPREAVNREVADPKLEAPQLAAKLATNAR